MTHSRLYLLIVAALMAISSMLSSCIEDGFTTSSSDRLAFNMDTVAFDTVITLQGTATKQMVVYNRSPKQISISSIKVAGFASKGHFYLNVDGIRGDEFKNVEIRGNDSIYIFIEAYIDEMESDEPTFIEDQLDFVTNGVAQHVALTAWGQDVIRLNADTIDHNRRFTANIRRHMESVLVEDALPAPAAGSSAVQPSDRQLIATTISNPARMVRYLTEAFYRELTAAGFDDSNVTIAAAHLVNCIIHQGQPPKGE